jgi:putative iron-regulated protein
MKLQPLVLAALLAGAAIAPTVDAQPAPAAAAKVDAAAVAQHYAVIVHASYSDTLDAARAMQRAIAEFVKSPSAQTQEAARKSWLAARELYGQTEAYRFYGGPIDDDRGPEGRINSWPMDEAYVDGVQGKPDSGIVNDRKQPLTKAALSKLNERGGEENIATGWHAIEFMLWGQDLSDSGPGNRSFTEFMDGKAPNADRRRQYLTVVTELLADDLGTLVRAWAPERKENYRARFVRGGNESIRKMLVGLGSLSRGELAGERLEVALASQDQEDEHSCFSDNTHRDAVANARGIQNVWLGQWRRPDGSVLQGASLRDLVAARDAAVAERTTAQIAKSVAAAEALQAPFDQEIRGERNAPGRLRVQATIDSLSAQARELVGAATAIGITRLTLVQPK